MRRLLDEQPYVHLLSAPGPKDRRSTQPGVWQNTASWGLRISFWLTEDGGEIASRSRRIYRLRCTMRLTSTGKRARLNSPESAFADVSTSGSPCALSRFFILSILAAPFFEVVVWIVTLQPEQATTYMSFCPFSTSWAFQRSFAEVLVHALSGSRSPAPAKATSARGIANFGTTCWLASVLQGGPPPPLARALEACTKTVHGGFHAYFFRVELSLSFSMILLLVSAYAVGCNWSFEFARCLYWLTQYHLPYWSTQFIRQALYLFKDNRLVIVHIYRCTETFAKALKKVRVQRDQLSSQRLAWRTELSWLGYLKWYLCGENMLLFVIHAF